VPQQKIVLNPKGLYTNVNQLGTVPPGALLTTKNVVMSRPGVVEVRRGKKTNAFFAKLEGQAGSQQWTAGTRPLRLFNAKLRTGGEAQTNYLGTPTPGMITMMADGTMYWSPDGVTYTKVNPTYGLDPLLLNAPNSDRHWYGFEQNGNFYITTSNGVIKVGRPLPTNPATVYAAPTADQIADWTRAGYAPAGVPWGVNTQATLTTANGTAVSPNCQVAYRFCFGYRDANNLLQLGAPSSRAVVVNAAANQTKDCVLATQVPPGIITSRHFWQLYRSLPSSSETTDPGDDCGLVAEGPIPSDVTIDQMSRTGTVLTCRTSTAHGLVPSTANDSYYVNLKNGVTVPGVASTNEFFIARSGNVRQIYKKSGSSGALSLVGSWSITQTETFTGASRPSNYPNAGRVILFRAEPTDGRLFYIEQYSGYLWIISSTGTTVTSVNLNCTVDAAAYEQGTRNIKMFGRPPASTSDVFDYCNPSANGQSGYYVTEFSTVTNSINYQSNGSALASPGTSVSTGQPVVFGPGAMVGSCRMGVWRARAGATAYICLVMYGSQQGSKVAISSDRGITWSYQYARSRGSSGLPVTCTAGDTVQNPNTGETTFTFAVNDNLYVDVYNIQNSGTDTPLLTGNWWEQYPNATTVQALALRVNKTTGRVGVSILIGNSPGNTDTVVLAVTAAGAWTFSQIQSLLTVATGAYASVGSPGFMQDSGNNFLLSWPNSTKTTGTQYVFDGTALTTSLIGTDPAYTWGGVGGSVDTTSAYVAPGTYKVLTTADTTHFTVASTQSPQVDFVATSVAVTMQQAEIYYTDTVDPAYIGPYLYSSPSVEGALQMNFPPPQCRDAALFRTTAFYANTISRTLVSITMLKLPVAGDRVYIGGNGVTNYVTAAATEDAGAFTYKIGTTGTLSQKIRATIESLAKVVNINWPTFRNLIYMVGTGATAYSTFFITAVKAGDSVSFKSTNSTGSALLTGYYTPNNVYGEAQLNKNLLAYSKTLSPDAVPLTNNIRIGSDSKQILRILPSRDALFVFKEDGCFIVRGYGPPWQVDPFDLTLQLTISDSLVTLDNAVFGAFARGVFKISDSNVELLSLPIQNLLERALVGDLNSDSNDYGFATADMPDHKYLLYLPTDTNVNDYADIVYVYDTFTNEWTTWDELARHVLSYRDTSLMHAFQTEATSVDSTIGTASGPYPSIAKENKNLTPDDFFDDIYWQIPSVSTDPGQKIMFYDTGGLLSTDSPPAVIMISQNGNALGWAPDVIDIIVPYGEDASYPDAIIVKSNSAPGSIIPISNESVPWLTPGANNQRVSVFRGIVHGWEFTQMFPESPAATNHFSELVVSFRAAYWSKLTALFRLPHEQQDPQIALQTVEFDGLHHFGPRRRASINNFIRTYVPRQSQRGTTLTAGILTSACGTPIESNGITVILTQGPASFQRR
jgi:hypothetical protein